MKVGILQTGVPPAALVPDYGTYADMMQQLLGAPFVCTTYDVVNGHLPDAPEAQDAYLITGSPAGVYDDLPWIAHLSDFLRAAKGRTKLVGICFGHQIMAQAFGGQVEKSDKGWGLGLHAYDIAEQAAWMDSGDPIAIPASHQDQVVACPPGARVLGSSAFTPYAVLGYDDGRSVSFQCHPEFSRAFAGALIAERRSVFPDADRVEAAVASLGRADDSLRVAGWIRRFLTAP